MAAGTGIVRCGFRNEEEVERNGREGRGRQLGTHGVTYLWLRKHVAGPWGQAVCLSATLTGGVSLPETLGHKRPSRGGDTPQISF